jgi:hypothetical protein
VAGQCGVHAVEFPPRALIKGAHKSMPLDQSASTARLSHISSLEPQTNSRRTVASQSHLRRLVVDARSIKAAIGPSGLLVLSGGVALAAICTAWSVQAGVTYPIAIAAGYCMAACSACLCAALAIVLNFSGPANPVKGKSEPTYAAWQVVKTLRVSEASRLWCDIEPGCAATQESLAWAQAMFNAIKSGELAVSDGVGTSNPHWATEVERSALKQWAASYGHSPRFLQG